MAQPWIGRETIELIQRRAEENVLRGADGIPGELLKLGIPVGERKG